MHKYVLMQTERGQQIKIIDNSTFLEKKKVDRLIYEGYKCIGYLESEQFPMDLLRGFNKDMIEKLDCKQDKLREIRKILDF